MGNIRHTPYFARLTKKYLDYAKKLGEDFFYFIYDALEQQYVLADRDSLETEISDTDFAPALEAILRIE